jgi:tRNA modification GTPase
VEQEGVRRSLAAIESADLVLIVLDGSQELTAEDRRVMDGVRDRAPLIVINKSDLPRKLESIDTPANQVLVSCRTGKGLDDLRKAVASVVMSGTAAVRGEHAFVLNRRHMTALEQAKESLGRVREAIRSDSSPEFPALDLRAALDQLGLVIGATYTDDILERIFNNFCIGK